MPQLHEIQSEISSRYTIAYPLTVKLINTSLTLKSGTLYSYMENTLNLENTTDEFFDNILVLLKTLFSNKLRKKRFTDTEMVFISFEGIDAIGKGTYSRLVTSLLNELSFNAKRINIPDYNSISGRIITGCLSAKLTEDDLYDKRLEFANHFAINRAEVKYNLKNDTTSKQPDFIIFDRWVNSSIAFTISKILLKHTEELKILGSDITLGKLNNAKDTPSIKIVYDEVIEAITYINKIEYEMFRNIKVDEEFILFADISDITKRIDNRKDSIPNSDNDKIDYDAHESKINLLETTQNVYKNIIYGSNVTNYNINEQYLLDTTNDKTFSEEENINRFFVKLIEALI